MTPLVLFVDDEWDVTEAMRVGMRSFEFDVVTARSADEALEILNQRTVDVVVSDERMPGMSGVRFLAHVREHHPDAERIILTGHASVETSIAAINDAQVFQFLTKPCSAADVAACVLDALSARGARAALLAATPGEPSRDEFDEAVRGISMWYQKIFDRNGAVVACEALLRCDHERLSGPVELLAAAGTQERKFDIDRRVRALVAADIGAGRLPSRVFVNLLPESLADPTLLGDQDPLHPHADGIVLEVTERASLSLIGGVRDKLSTLRSRGYGIALDDLGAGYAGLTSFTVLDPNVVKFDYELVRDVDTMPRSRRLIESMLEVCQELDVTTVAEGIETQAEFDELAALGVDLFQGYLLAKPEPLSG